MDVVIDGSRIQVERDFHRMLADRLEFGDSYGYNRAALWDRLSTDVLRPVRVLWQQSATSRANLGEDAFLGLVEILDRVVEQDRALGLTERFEYLIE